MAVNKHLEDLRYKLQKASDHQTAIDQAKYLRNQFPFYGCKTPVLKEVVKEAVRKHGLPAGEELKAFVRQCYQDPHREMHHAGLLILGRRIRKEPKEIIEFLETCIQTKSWWDTVDHLAKLTGGHILRFPELQYPTCEKWMGSGNMWLQRVAIIHQLAYREKTNAGLLYSLILQVADSKEFFLQKASGWALRQYSRTDPASVRAFIADHKLAPLTVREGMRLIRSGKV